MPRRATENDVKAVIDTDLTVDQVAPFLRAANAMVDEVLSGAAYGAELERQIETWLAAHLVAVRDPRIVEEKIGDATAKYAIKIESAGLQSTSYGQQVLAMDYRGMFAAAAAAKGVVDFEVMP